MTYYSQEEKAVAATAIFKMKVQQAMEMFEEEHLQNTCRAEIIFEDNAYEEYEEIQMEDLEQAPPKFKDTQPQVHDPMEEVNLNTVEEPRITYISYLLPSDFKERILQHYRNSKTALLGIMTRCQDWIEAWCSIACLLSQNFTIFSNYPEECQRR